MPRACSSSEIASLARGPNTSSGSSSRVTISIRASSRRALACAAAISASSYSGSGQALPLGSTNARRAVRPSSTSRSSSRSAGTSGRPRNANAPGTAGTECAPSAMMSSS